VRITRDSGANSMLQFQFERGGDRTNRCRKIKRRQRARLSSMRRKYDTTSVGGEAGVRRGKGRR
jgi:hypothetical protein